MYPNVYEDIVFQTVRKKRNINEHEVKKNTCTVRWISDLTGQCVSKPIYKTTLIKRTF
jgi:hypothetical protein